MGDSTSDVCTHCGLPAPASPQGPAFCCAGCRTAHGILEQAGLLGFYSLRATLDTDGSRQPAELEVSARRRYAHFDDAEFLREHAHADTIELDLDGLHCAACVWLIERLPQMVDGVDQARVDFGRKRLRLQWDQARAPLSEVAGLLHRFGYAARPHVAGDGEPRSQRSALLRIAVAGALAGNVMLASIALYAAGERYIEPHYVQLFEWASFVLSIPAVTYGAWPFYRGAWAGLRMRMLHMDLPVALGVAGGFLASVVATFTGSGHAYYDTITVLVFLLLAGRHLQQWGHERAWNHGDLMLALLPGSAELVDKDGTRTVYARSLRVGDRIRVGAEAVFPADGTIVAGQTHVDLGLLTGESRMCARSIGDRVLAGSTNLVSDVDVHVDATDENTRVGQLLRTMADTASPAPIVRLADKISGWFVATVIALAIGGGVAWWWIDPTRAFDVVVALLVVSCPCALGLATPATIFVARARAGRHGLLLKDAGVIEALARVRRLVLDKTGTLTTGKMQASVAWGDAAPWASFVLTAETGASHPVGQALRTWAQQANAACLTVEQREEIPGRGVSLTLADSRRVRIGSAAWIETRPPGVAEAIDRCVTAGHSPVLVQVDDRVVAVFALGDSIRHDAVDSLDRLRELGLQLAVRSGDTDGIVQHVARLLGIDDARGDLQPEDKARDVADSPHTAMLGDGINDAPALHAAAVGIAVGGGAQAAMKVADVYLQRGDLFAVADLFAGAKRAMGLIRRGLVFSLAYNVVFASLALLGGITPLWAAVLMPISSFTVVGNAVFGRSFGGGLSTRDESRSAVGRDHSTCSATSSAMRLPITDQLRLSTTRRRAC